MSLVRSAKELVEITGVLCVAAFYYMRFQWGYWKGNRYWSEIEAYERYRELEKNHWGALSHVEEMRQLARYAAGGNMDEQPPLVVSTQQAQPVMITRIRKREYVRIPVNQ